jgi:hypothetical protein
MSTTASQAVDPKLLIDPAGPLRAGEPLDIAAVDRFLKSRLPSLTGEPEVRQFPICSVIPSVSWCCGVHRSVTRPRALTTWCAKPR